MQFLHFCFGLGSFIAPLCIAVTGLNSYLYFGLIAMALIVPALLFHSPAIHKKQENIKDER